MLSQKGPPENRVPEMGQTRRSSCLGIQFSFTVACHRVGERHEDALSEFRAEREEEV